MLENSKGRATFPCSSSLDVIGKGSEWMDRAASRWMKVHGSGFWRSRLMALFDGP